MLTLGLRASSLGTGDDDERPGLTPSTTSFCGDSTKATSSPALFCEMTVPVMEELISTCTVDCRGLAEGADYNSLQREACVTWVRKPQSPWAKAPGVAQPPCATLHGHMAARGTME